MEKIDEFTKQGCERMQQHSDELRKDNPTEPLIIEGRPFNCKIEEKPKEEWWGPDETYVLPEYEYRKATELSRLHLKVEAYLYDARCILEELTDKEDRYKALGVLWDDIDKENGGYMDDRECVPDEEDMYKIGVKTGLIEPDEKMRMTDVLRNYLDRVEKVTGAGENVANTGWSWEPAERLYPAVVVLYWLRKSIRKEMRNLHRQIDELNEDQSKKIINQSKNLTAMEMNETKRRHIAFALTAVLLNEDHEEPDLEIEEIDQINNIFEKICDVLNKEEIKALAKVRLDTFVNAMNQVKALDELMSDTPTDEKIEE